LIKLKLLTACSETQIAHLRRALGLVGRRRPTFVLDRCVVLLRVSVKVFCVLLSLLEVMLEVMLDVMLEVMLDVMLEVIFWYFCVCFCVCFYVYLQSS
jgi:hypothetical protein